MTYDETTLFTKFMEGKGVMNNFYSFYRLYKHDNRDVNAYLDEVDAEDVIMSAFDFKRFLNTSFGVKYWQEINDKWMTKLTEFRNTGVMNVEDLMVYCPHCGRTLPRSAFAIKSNMQLHKHCKECEGGKWDREKKEREKAEKEAEKQAKAMAQLEKEIAEKQAKLERQRREIERLEGVKADAVVGEVVTNNRAESARREIAEGQANLGKTTKICGHCGKRKLRTEFYASDSSEDGLQEYCKTCQTELLAAAEEAQRKEDEQRRLEIEIADREAEMQRMKAEQEPAVKPKPIRPDKLTAPKLGEYDATLHYKQNQKSLTLNATLSAQIRDGEFSKCYLNIDRSKRVFLIFNRVEGANVTGASTLTQTLLNVTSADIARTLAARFDLDLGENYYLHITKNLSKKDEFLTIEVLAARSREEYIKIAERRELVAKGKIPPYEAEEEPVAHEDPEPQDAGTPESQGDGSGGQQQPSGHDDAPLLDFSTTLASLSDPTAVLDYLVENGHVTERDLAVYLHNKGWELQEPVIVKKLKKFSL